MIEYRLPLPKKHPNNPNSNALMTVNVQRNLHHIPMATFKRQYSSTIKQVLSTIDIPTYTYVRITYTLFTKPTRGNPTKKQPYRGSKPRNLDLLNLLAVVDKSNSDVLVELGVIPDDTITYVQSVHFDCEPYSDDDYVLVRVIPVLKKEDPRQ